MKSLNRRRNFKMGYYLSSSMKQNLSKSWEFQLSIDVNFMYPGLPYLSQRIAKPALLRNYQRYVPSPHLTAYISWSLCRTKFLQLTIGELFDELTLVKWKEGDLLERLQTRVVSQLRRIKKDLLSTWTHFCLRMQIHFGVPEQFSQINNVVSDWPVVPDQDQLW